MSTREEEIEVFRMMFKVACSNPDTVISVAGKDFVRLMDVVMDQWINLLEEETIEKGAAQRKEDTDCVNYLLNDCDIPLGGDSEDSS